MAETIIGFRVDDEIAERLRKQAEREDRSVSGLLRRLVAKHLKEQQDSDNGKGVTDEMPTLP